MNKILSIVLLFVIWSHSQAQNKNTLQIIPQPNKVELSGGNFDLSRKSVLVLMDKNKSLGKLGNYLSKQLSTLFQIQIAETRSNVIPKAGNSICLKTDASLKMNEEAYSLVVSKSGIIITAADSKGLFYGIQTLLQLIPAKINTSGSVSVPCLKIVDSPRFGWRGMHLDVSRHFFPKENLKQFIDIMAMYKLNVFHWHLCDDQGWRIEIKKYPRLTEIGAWRIDEAPDKWSYFTKNGDGKTDKSYGGFYTQEDIKEIVAYATERNITVLPEIEMPGHMAAVLFAYPELSCSGKPWVKDPKLAFEFSDPYCAGNEKTFGFLEDVLKEVMDLFPSHYIHVGGDECKKGPWEKCPKCQARMQTEKLKNVAGLQSYFISRIGKFINSKGRSLIGWDEILEGGLSPNASVMAWRSEEGGIEVAKLKHNVVMVPSHTLYFDADQTENLAAGQLSHLNRIYNYDPVPANLPAGNTGYILGAQGCLWTENVYNYNILQIELLPRIAALAEVVWTNNDRKNYPGFLSRLESQFYRYDKMGMAYYINAPVGLDSIFTNGGSHSFALKNELPFGEIRYTTDGTAPDLNSLLYEKPLSIEAGTQIQARTIYPNGKMSATRSGYVSKLTTIPAVSVNPQKPGVTYRLFEGLFAKCDEVESGKLIKTGIADNFVMPVEHPDDKFGVVYNGFINIPENEIYEFWTSSDDGSRLYIDEMQVVNNDGNHGAQWRKGSVALQKGFHKIKVIFYDALYGEALEVHFCKQGKIHTEIPGEILKHE